MTENDFPQFIKSLAATYPGKFDKMTSEQFSVWKRVLTSYPIGDCKQALQDYAGIARFAPQPIDIKNRAVAIRNERSAESVGSVRFKDVGFRVHRQEWEHIATVVANVSDEGREQHKQSAMQADWRLRWMKDKPSTGRGWLTIIAKRISRRLEPDAIDAMCEVPVRT